MQRTTKTAFLIAILVASLAGTEARAGGLYRLIYGQSTPIRGDTVEALTNSPGFPTVYDSIDLIGFQGQSEPLYRSSIQQDNPAGTNTGSLTEGFLEPPQTGLYSFWVSGQDSEEFWLSSDATAANAQLLINNLMSTADVNWSSGDSQKAANVPLQQGNKYYFKLLQKTYYGTANNGENYYGNGDLALGWQLPDGTLERPMWAYYAQPYTNAAIAPAIAFSDPLVALPPSATNDTGDTYAISDTNVSTTIVENDKIVFQITMNASSLTNAYQWYDNGTAIPGATMSYYVTRALLAENGHEFTCVVNNSLTNTPVTLTLTADTAALGIVSTYTKGNPTQVFVQFSKPVNPASATNQTSYALNYGATVSSAAMLAEDTVVLTTSALAVGNTYTLTVNNVTDTSATPNTIAANTTALFALVDGVVQVNMWWPGPDANLLSDLESLATNDLGTMPTNSFWTTSFETPFWDDGQWLFGQIRGYLTPLTNGDYEFGIAAWQSGALYLSTDATPTNKVLVASCDDQENDFRAYYENALSSPVTLVGGQRYYIEALWLAEHSDSLPSGINVAWQAAGSGTIVNGGPAIPAQFLSAYKTSGSVKITNSLPATTNVVEDQSITLSIGVDGVDGTPAYTYQWEKNGIPITGANDVTYVTPPLTLADQGATFTLVVSNSFSSASTSTAIGTVTANTTAPTLLGAGSLQKPFVTVTFSGPVTPATALNLANYTLKDPSNNPVALSNPVLSVDGTQVTLTAASLTTYAPYTLSVQNVKDISAAGNVMDPASSSFAPINLIARNMLPGEQLVQNRLQPWSVKYVGTNLMVHGYGYDFWYEADMGIFAYTAVTNDFDFCLQINEFDWPGFAVDSANGKFGLAAREYDATAHDGKEIFAWADNPNGWDIEMIMRPLSDGSTGSTFAVGSNYDNAMGPGGAGSWEPNEWLRLQRVGNVFTQYYGTNGENWTLIAFEDTDADSANWTDGGMPSVLYLGIGECTKNTAIRCNGMVGYFGPSIVPIKITTQPPATVTVGAGQPLTLQVIAMGFPLHYQWQLNGTPIPDATNASYTIDSASETNAGSYTVVLSNIDQSDVLSAASVVQVGALPAGLAIQLVGTTPVITWTSGVLQQANTLTGPWSDVSDASSPYNVPAGPLYMFYRLRSGD